MSKIDRFNQLWNDYLEGELDEVGMAELKDILGSDEGYLQHAVDSFQTHRLLGLSAQDSESRHEAFVRQTMEKLPAQQNRFVGDVMQAIPKRTTPWIFRIIPNWAMSAAVAVIAMTLLWSIFYQRPRMIAEISGMSGPVQWTGDGGSVIMNLKAGVDLPGGTVEGLSPSSWVELQFKDGSTITLSGDFSLTFSDMGQKELHLKRGGISADVVHQSKPMLIYTRSAVMEVLGTKFGIETELASTTLSVSSGSVSITRNSDRSSVTVRAKQRVIADVDHPLTPTTTPVAVHSWSSDMRNGPKRMYGKWLPDGGKDGGRLNSIPYLTPDKKTIYTAAMGVSRRDHSPVVLKRSSHIRVRGVFAEHSHLYFGVELRHADGEFAGRFQIVRSTADFPLGQAFDVSLPISDYRLDPSLREISANLPAEPHGLIVAAIWCHSLYNQAGLAVTHFEVSDMENAETQ